jgi:tripartite-type tricarboxylate transporter receptor subunit TctC
MVPQVPIVAESGVTGYEANSWGGVMAPARTPRSIIDKLIAEVNRALGMPGVRERLAELSIELIARTVRDSPRARNLEVEASGR